MMRSKMFTDAMITEELIKISSMAHQWAIHLLFFTIVKALLEESGIDIDFDSVTPDNRLTWEQLIDYSNRHWMY